MKNTLLAFLFLTNATGPFAGDPNEAVLAYIERYRFIAVEEMIQFGIPASITLAQGILESGAGRSDLASKSNNHFGIKCHTDWTGDRVYHDDDAKGECFRKYDKPEDSFRDHSFFLSTRSRYADLFVLDPMDYKGWAKGLKSAGYATNPQYADRLISIIDDYKLYDFDKLSPEQLLAMENNKKVDKKTQDKSKDADKKDETNYTTALFYFNRIPTIVVNPGETLEILAQRHQTRTKNLLKYNDLKVGEQPQPGTYLYLQPKRKKGANKYHTVKPDETMWIISRDEGVRLDKLYKYNMLTPGQEPASGQIINLRKKREAAPRLVEKVKEIGDKEKREMDRKEKEIQTEEERRRAEEAEKEKNKIIMDFEDGSDKEPQGIPKKNEAPGAWNISQPTYASPILTAYERIPIPLYHHVESMETLFRLARVYNTTIDNLMEWNQLTDNNIRTGQQLIIGYRN